MFFFTDLEHAATTATGVEVYTTKDTMMKEVGGAMATKTMDGRTMVIMSEEVFNSSDFNFIVNHEVAHILNGDLEAKKSGMVRSIKAEKMADSYAIRMGVDKKEAMKILTRISFKVNAGVFTTLWGKSKTVTLAFAPLLVPLVGLSFVLSLTARIINIARTKV